MKPQSNWKRDLLVIPLVVGIVVAAVTYVFPFLFEKGKQLSYSIDGPIVYLNSEALGKAKITIDGVEATNIFGCKVRIWNSGSVALTSLPIRFVFDKATTNFTIFNVSHDTIPKEEFGKIEEVGSDATSKRFVYELLNPKDQDELTFITDSNVKVSVYSKAEGLQTKQAELNVVNPWFQGLNFILTITSAALALFAYMLKTKRERLELEHERISLSIQEASGMLEQYKSKSKDKKIDSGK
jgi:hypothetical protein